MDLTAGVAISLHLFLNGDYNPIHPYAQLEKNDWALGAYYNSESTVSGYVSKTYELGNDYEVELGVVTGYSDTAILPMVRLRKGDVFVMPAMETWNGEKNVGLVIGYQF